METEGDCHSKAAVASPTEDDDRDSHADLVSVCGVPWPWCHGGMSVIGDGVSPPPCAGVEACAQGWSRR